MSLPLPLIIALVPLVVAPNFLFYFDVTPKILLLLVGTAAMLPFAAKNLQLLWNRRLGRALCVLLGIEALSLAVSTLFSPNPWLSLSGTNWRRFGALTQWGVLMFTLVTAGYIAAQPQRVRQILRAICASGVLVALYGILQYFGWDPWIPKPAYHIGEGIWTIVRPPATLGHASYFATYLLSVVFAGIALANIEAGVWKAVGRIATILGSIAIILSGTRAAILGLAAGAIFLLIWLPPKMKLQWMAAATAIAAAAVAFYFSPAGLQLRSRSRWYFEDPQGGARLWLWRDSLRMARAHWLSGAGVETFSSAFPRFESVELARAYPNFYHESPHNIFFDALAAQGILGLSVLVAVIALGFYAAWRGGLHGLKLERALAAGFAAIVISEQFASFTLPTALFFYLSVAVLVGLSKPPAEPQHSLGRLLMIPAVALSLVLCVFAVQLAAWDRHLAKTSACIKAGDTNRAIEEYARAESWRPRGASAALWYSRAMAVAASRSPNLLLGIRVWQHAFHAAVDATKKSEDPHNAWYNLASFYAAQNNFARTEQSLRSAIGCAPNWFKPHWMLARALRATGRLLEADAEAVVAAHLDAGKDPEVWQTLQQIRAALSR